jgi:pimeloyl-ACP methyl ester carboxylesterase
MVAGLRGDAARFGVAGAAGARRGQGKGHRVAGVTPRGDGATPSGGPAGAGAGRSDAAGCLVADASAGPVGRVLRHTRHALALAPRRATVWVPKTPSGLVRGPAAVGWFAAQRRLAHNKHRTAAEPPSMFLRMAAGTGSRRCHRPQVFAAFAPQVPIEEALARRFRNPEIGEPAWTCFVACVVDQLARSTCPALVCVGELDPAMPPAASREILEALFPGSVTSRPRRQTGYRLEICSRRMSACPQCWAISRRTCR